MGTKEILGKLFPRKTDLPSHFFDHPDFDPAAPHPPDIIANPCSGSSANESEHVYHIIGQTWVWDTRSKPPMWRLHKQKLSEWLLPEELPKTLPFNGQLLPVERTQSHGLCDDCILRAPEHGDARSLYYKSKQSNIS